MSGPKPLHTLRKEYGSRICDQFGICAASRALRHADIAITSQHYVDKKRRTTLGLGHLLRDSSKTVPSPWREMRYLRAGLLFHTTKKVVKTINSSAMNLRAPEWQVLALLVPWNVGLEILGFLRSWLMMVLLERTGLTRFTWHVPLCFLGLLALLTSL